MREPLLFDGIRWSGAKVVDRKQVIATSIFTEKKVPWTEALIIETSGNGRSYSVTHAEAWWRDFADLLPDHEESVLSFLARRGDPFGRLAPDGTQINTGPDWLAVKGVLRHAARAWTPLDETGVSRFRPDALEIAGRFLHSFTTDEWTSQLSVVYEGLIPVLRAKVLAAYMLAAAAASLRAGLDMRRCDYCHSWFTLHYATARQCSASCRAARFNKRSSPHGLLSQDHDSQGSDSLAKPVAGAGNERPPAGAITKLRKPKGSGSARSADARNRKSRRRRPAPA